MTSDSKSSQPRGPQTPSTPRRQRAGVPITPGSASRDRSIDAGRPPSTLGNRSPSPIKVRAPLSVEAKQRKKVTSFSGVHNSSAKIRSAANSPVPSTPPRNPNFERPKSSHAKPFPSLVRQIFSQAEDPEESLVDWRSVPPDDGDVSIEVDDDSNFFAPDAGSQDKVLVSVRIKPSAEGEESAWFSEQLGVVKLRDIHARPGATNPEYRYDNVLTGSFNKEIYNAAAKSHVRAAMEGFNAVIFAYGQTASGKTFTLSGSEEQPGIIPRAMRDVFQYIRKTPAREFLLRASYLEIYKEQIHDLLSPSSSSSAAPSLTLQDNGVVVGLREEVIMSVKGLKDVLERGEANRRTASTDWNARSSRSHSVFRLIIESRESGPPGDESPSLGPVPCTPGGSRLQARGGRSVRSSTLSLIDLAGSERATANKERTNEGKYINQSLLTLGTVIGTLAENAGKKKQDFVPFRNSKLTKLLQPSLSGNARISVICTLNPTPSSVSESTSTLQFASRVKKVALHAVRKEVVDTDALIERYRKEIEELKARLEEREREVAAPTVKRRLSAREKMDENRAMNDLNSRIKQLTKLILTSQTVEDSRGDESRPASPTKLDFDLTPFQLQEQLLAAKRTIESQATQILSLEASLSARPLLPADAPETEKDRLIDDLRKTVRELEIVTAGYEDNLGAPLRAVKEDVENEWKPKVEELENQLEDKSDYIQELERALEREKQMRLRAQQEKLALAGFVRLIDSHISSTSSLSALSSSSSTSLLSGPPTSSLLPTSRPSLSPVTERTKPARGVLSASTANKFLEASPKRPKLRRKTSMLDVSEDEISMLMETEADRSIGDISFSRSPARIPFADKENAPPA